VRAIIGDMSETGRQSDSAGAGKPESVNDKPARRPAVSRQRLQEVFGEVLPETTSDERDDGSPRDTDRDEWFLANRPPHH